MKGLGAGDTKAALGEGRVGGGAWLPTCFEFGAGCSSEPCLLWKGLQLTPSCPAGRPRGGDAERWWPGWEAPAHFSNPVIQGVLG